MHQNQKDGRLTTVLLHLTDTTVHTYRIVEVGGAETVSITFQTTAEPSRRHLVVASGLSWPTATQYILAVQDIYMAAADYVGYGQQDDKTELPVEWMQA